MSENKIIKCAQCQQNAEIDPRIYRSEYAVPHPIRDKDGQIYCWDCYKNKSHCEGCGKSVAKIKFPKSGNPTFPHCGGGYSRECERVKNEVNFLCSEKCAESIDTKRYQNWKEKLIQGWTKCEECWKFWVEEWKWCGMKEWIKEEKNHQRFVKLVQPGQGKLCSEHKEWEENGRQEYERKNAEYQKRWEALSNEEKLSEVKKEYRHGENVTEITACSAIPPMVLSKWKRKDSHRQNKKNNGIEPIFYHNNCPDCQLDHEPIGNDNNYFVSTSENGSESSVDNKIEKLRKELIGAKSQGKSQKEIERLRTELQKLNQQKEMIIPAKKNNELILETVVIFFSVFAALILGVILISKNNKKKK